MGLPVMVATPTLPLQFTVLAGIIPCPGIIVTVTTPPSLKIFVNVLGAPFPVFCGPLSFLIAGVDTLGNVITGAMPGMILPTTLRVFGTLLPVIRLGDSITIPTPVVNPSGVPLVIPYTITVTNAGQTTVFAE